MTDESGENAPGHSAEEPREQPRARNWDSVTALIAAMIGVLALLVSGYTAYIQRQQVRAEVWPNLLIGFYDPDRSIGVHNKGVGPAIVRSVQVWVDGAPQGDWSGVLTALGLPTAGITISTISGTVISPGERVLAISMADADAYQRFRSELVGRVNTEICYCSTLGECWLHSDRMPNRKPGLTAIDQCPVVADDQAFSD
jgi:hypothetical protein